MVESKVCTRCFDEKALSEFQIDARREGLSRYQQPCKECRNKYNRSRRKVNSAKNKLEYCDFKHIKGFLEFSEEHKRFEEARLLLNKAIKNRSNVFVQGGYGSLIIGCVKCNHVTNLPDLLPGNQLCGVINVYEEHHKLCD